MFNSNNPFNNTNSLIDKMLGNSYRIIKDVWDNLKEIRYVSYNMEDIHAVATGTVRSQLLLTGTTLNPTTEIPLPNQFLIEELQSASVIMITTIGNKLVFSPSESTFSWKIENGDVVVSLSDPVNPILVGSTIKCLLTYQPVPGSN